MSKIIQHSKVLWLSLLVWGVGVYVVHDGVLDRAYVESWMSSKIIS